MAGSRWGLRLALAAMSLAPAHLYAQDSSAVAPPPIVVDSAQSAELDTLDVMRQLYLSATQALQTGNFREAADRFEQFASRYTTSSLIPQAFYWRAFALYRLGGDTELHQALALLHTMRDQHPTEFSQGDAQPLESRIVGELARRGDPNAAQMVSQINERRDADSTVQLVAAASNIPADIVAVPRDISCDASDSLGPAYDVRISALNALAQMNKDRAGPVLQELLTRRDEGSRCLRRVAILLLAQLHTNGAEMSLLDAARNDPNLEIRLQAVLFLSQFNTEHSISALDSIVRTSTEEPLIEQAMMALAQSDNPRAHEALRAYAARTDLTIQKRSFAIRWLVARPSAENVAFLRALYSGLDTADVELRRSVILSTAQQPDSMTGRWLLAIFHDETEHSDLRSQALVLGTPMVTTDDLVALYAPTLPTSLRLQLLTAYADRREEIAALDALGTVAKRDPEKKLRRRAVSVISRSQHPHAAEVLQAIVNEP